MGDGVCRKLDASKKQENDLAHSGNIFLVGGLTPSEKY